MHDTVSLEAMAIPTAVVVTSEFIGEARAQGGVLGMPDIAPVIIDHPLSTLTPAGIDGRAAQALPQVKKAWLG